MESRSDQPPLVVILGETASGKSALALELAQMFNGEIIAADSRTVYRGMDIGTAKPSSGERQLVPHHLLDVVTPDQTFTVADFKRLADEAIYDISKRGNVPFLVGGTGLYIDAVLYDFSFRGGADQQLRTRLQHMTADDLQALILEKGISLPANSRNPRHLLRTLETEGAVAGRKPLRRGTLILGLEVDREGLRERITRRVEAMQASGFSEEVQRVAESYGWNAPALQAPGYKAFRRYLAGEIDVEEAKHQFVQNDMQLAKRQRTWFRRNKSIRWISRKEEAVDLLATFLNK